MTVRGSNKSTALWWWGGYHVLLAVNVTVALKSDAFSLSYSCFTVEMNTPHTTFTSTSAVDAFLVYRQELRENEKYIDLEIEVSCCYYK